MNWSFASNDQPSLHGPKVQLGLPDDARALTKRSTRSRPWRSNATQHLWTDSTTRECLATRKGEMMSAMQFRTIESTVGPLTLAGEGRNLMHLSMVDPTHEPSHSGWERDDKAFSDSRREFDLELDLVGTSFQRRVWEALGLVAGLYAASSVALAELLLGCSRQRRRTSASGGRPLLGRSRDDVPSLSFSWSVTSAQAAAATQGRLLMLADIGNQSRPRGRQHSSTTTSRHHSRRHQNVRS